MEDSLNTNSRPWVYSFVSYKGGVGRTSMVVNTARTLTLQGVNVLLVDLDLEGAGIPIFSSLDEPEPMFQPENIYPLKQDNLTKRKSLYDIWNALPKKPKNDLDFPCIELPGILNHLDGIPSVEELPGFIRSNIEVYEYRSPSRQHPLEGRMFFVPAGGRFDFFRASDQSNDLVDIKATKWIYHPLSSDKKEFRAIFSNEWMMDEELGFFAALIEHTVSMCNEVLGRDTDNRDAINYVLLDERPGMTPRGMIASTPSDGMILLASGSRGNLAGVYDLLLALQGHIDPDDKDHSLFPPIVGLTIGPLLEGIKGGVQAGIDSQTQTQALINAILYTDWKEVLGPLKQRNVIQPPKISDFDKFDKLLRNIFMHTDYFQPLSDSQDFREKTLWGNFAHMHNGVREFCDTFVPYFFDQSLLMHDRVYNLHGYCKNDEKVSSFDDSSNASSVLLMAGHLRELNENDTDFRAWELLYDAVISHESTELLERGFENKWLDLEAHGDFSWRYHWYYALWLERKANILKTNKPILATESFQLAVDNLEKAEDLQRYVYRVYNSDWPGDWRIILKKAQLLYEIGRFDASRNEYLRVLDCLSKYPASEQVELRKEIAKIHMLLAGFYIDEKDYDNAWLSYQKIMGSDYDEPDLLAKRLYELLFLSVKVEQGELRSRYQRIVDYLEDNARRHRYFRGRIRYYLALFQMYWYRRMSGFQSGLESMRDKLVYLDQVYKILSESLNENDAPLSEVRSLLGEINLEYAYLNRHEPNKVKGHYFDALKNLLVATGEHPESIKNHMYLAIARCLDSYYHQEERPLSPDSIVAMGQDDKEKDTKDRHAFYAFEQAIALCVNAEKPDNYFLEDEVKRLSRNLPTYIKLAAQKYQPENLYSVVNEWIDKMFPPDPNYQENAEYFAEILSARTKKH